MERTENKSLRQEIIQHLANQYKIYETREPNHLSTFVYCRTKAFLDSSKSVADPTEQEVLLFALGYGLQDVLTPKNTTLPIIEKEGIIYRPDFIITRASVERLNELKTTRRSMKNHWEALPETWVDYMAGGCYMRDCNKYDLTILYMMGSYAPPFPDIICETDEFSDGEIEENWYKIRQRKNVLDSCIKDNKVPTPFENCYLWECKYCRYKLICETIVQINSRQQVEKDIKELW